MCIMAVFVELFDSFGLTIFESKTETVCMPISRALVTHIVFNATGATVLTNYFLRLFEGRHIETPNLTAEIDRRIPAGWISFRHYTWELYDHLKASLLHPKARMRE